MSKNVAILEGNTAKRFRNTKKIQTHNLDGSTDYWVPEDETKLGTKTITKNGTYIAAEEEDGDGTNRGWYGYEKVIVRGIGKGVITAREGDTIGGVPLEDGEEYAIGKDPDTGEPTAILLPSSIAFYKPPTRLIYQRGETITLAGAEIYAYKASGGDWSDADHPNGAIKLSEVTWSPTVVGGGSSTHTSDSGVEHGGGSLGTFSDSGDLIPFKSFTNDLGTLILRNFTSDVVVKPYFYVNWQGYWPDIFIMSKYSQTIEFSWSGSTSSQTVSPVSVTNEKDGIYWGNIDLDGKYSKNLYGWPETSDAPNDFIPDYLPDSDLVQVFWERPEDGKTLRTSFEIEINNGE